MSDNTNNEDRWISTADAAKILRLSHRQTNRYGEIGRLKRRRIGRKLQYKLSEVHALADELNSIERPMPMERKPPDTRLLEYLQARDEQFDTTQQQLTKTQHQIEERLERIETQLDTSQKQSRSTLVIALMLAIAAIIALSIVLVVVLVIA